MGKVKQIAIFAGGVLAVYMVAKFANNKVNIPVIGAYLPK